MAIDSPAVAYRLKLKSLALAHGSLLREFLSVWSMHYPPPEID